MKLYWGPGTCALGIHILLEEAGAAFETEKIDVHGGATHEPRFLAINPKGKVPTLVFDDGSVLTEFSAIATWIAKTYPGKRLLPEAALEQARSVEVMAYVEGTIHGQGYGRIFKPEKYEPQDVVHGKLGLGQSNVRHQGHEMVEQGFAIIDPQLEKHPYVAGAELSIGDAALFFCERWAPKAEITLPPNVKLHYERMLTRPAVEKVMKLWGEWPAPVQR